MLSVPVLIGAAIVACVLMAAAVLVVRSRLSNPHPPPEPIFPRPSVRIITDPIELAELSRRTADEDYRLAMRLLLRGAHHAAAVDTSTAP